jgi:Ca2+-binding RTX toxin-like protein
MAIIIGNNGDNTLNGGSQGDLILGLKGDDTIDGGGGNDFILAGKGDDTIDGGDGNDYINGGKGDDVITGGAGNDYLVGGKGDDEFVFEAGFGCDLIRDFKSGAGSDDRIRLIDTEATDFASLILLASNVGNYVKIAFTNGDSLYLRHTSVADLHEDDFIFETTAAGLFTNNADVVDFNSVNTADYTAGTQYDGLDGDDVVVLADNAAAAAAAGYTVGTAFNAGAGNDTVTGGALDDVINGDAGNDTLNAGTGVDVLNGGADDDRLIFADINAGESADGGTGNDTFEFAAANGSGHTISASDTQVTVDGTTISITNVENYILSGADGNDSLSANGAGVELFGNGGNDNIFLNSSNIGSSSDGGSGFDILFYFDSDISGTSRNVDNVITVNAGSLTIDGVTTTATNFERFVISGLDGNDTISGGNLAESLSGGAGNDTIDGGDGSDSISGGTGNDTLNGDAGNDTISISDGGDTIDGGADNDTLEIQSALDTQINIATGVTDVGGVAGTAMNIENVTGGTGNDNIIGDAGNNTLTGLGRIDILRGEGGNDTLIGGDGEDVLWDEDGRDSIDGGAGANDLLRFVNVTATTINVDLSTNVYDVGGNAGSVSGVEKISTSGLTTNDTVTGTSVNEQFILAAGIDIVDAGAGNDVVSISDGGDTIDGGLDFDALVVTTNEDVDVVLGTGALQIGTDAASIATGFERVITGGGNDEIIGTAGNDVLESGAGNDRIFALAGTDIILAGNDDDLVFVNDLAGDNADGGAGQDAIQFNFSQSVNFDLATGVATLVGGGSGGSYQNFELATIFGPGGAIVSATDGVNNIDVRGTGNTISLLDGNDGLNVTEGGNFVDGGAGNDSIRFDTNEDVTIDLSAGTTSILGVAGTITGFEVIRTRGGDDTVTGSINGDRIEVHTGADTVNAGDGSDIVFVVDGGDTLDGGSGINDALFVVSTETTVVDMAAGTLQIGTDALTNFTDFESFVGSTGVDNVTGSAGSDDIQGRDGNDILNGGAGADVIRGEAGDDTIRGGDGNDFMVDGVGLGNDTYIFDIGDDFDTIAGFTAGAGVVDVIDIQAFGFASFTDVMNAATDSGVNVSIDFDGVGGTDGVLLTGLNKADLVADDFLI